MNEESVDSNSSEFDDTTFVPSADMELFYVFFHLISPDGGNRHIESSEQTVNEVRRACIFMNATGFTRLFKITVIREVNLISYCQKRGHLADAMKIYLLSMISFCTFLIVDDIHVVDTDKEDILKTKLILSNYKSSYKKKSRKRF